MTALEALCKIVGFEPTKKFCEDVFSFLQRAEDSLARRAASAKQVLTALAPVSATISELEKPIKPLRTADQPASVPIEGLYDPIGAFMIRACASAAAPGYEQLLIQLYLGPLAARACAYLVIRRGRRSFNDSVRLSAVVKAIRFFAKPHTRSDAIHHRAEVLIDAWRETSVFDEIFDAAGLDVFQFIRLLEAVIDGNKAALPRLRAIAATLAPQLSVSRGPKISAQSAAHEFFLRELSSLTDSGRYTWKSIEGDFTDNLTKATRLAFGDPRFNPQSAVRRLDVA